MWMALASHRTWLLGQAEKLLMALLRGWRPVPFLNAIEGNPICEQWYRRILNFTAARFIDRDKGGEHRSTTPHCARMRAILGKVDIYEASQACLIPTLPTTGSVTRGLLETNST
jgi:hypothetical protein